ncbi:MAG TPA: hypothetical protein VM537_27830 [Anaerolineae bacterium]|nr:hypothetical protein [Anaerolineae bacterium]
MNEASDRLIPLIAIAVGVCLCMCLVTGQYQVWEMQDPDSPVGGQLRGAVKGIIAILVAALIIPVIWIDAWLGSRLGALWVHICERTRIGARIKPIGDVMALIAGVAHGAVTLVEVVLSINPPRFLAWGLALTLNVLSMGAFQVPDPVEVGAIIRSGPLVAPILGVVDAPSISGAVSYALRSSIPQLTMLVAPTLGMAVGLISATATSIRHAR